MNEQPLQPVMTSHQRARAAWREQLDEVMHDPCLKLQLARREHEVFPRFAERYQRLVALPRRARRGLQRQWRRSLAGVALLMALGPGPALAANFIIPCSGGVGDSAALIAAINAANNDSSPDTITLAASCTHTFTSATDTGDGPTALPTISSNITIAGNGSTIRRDGPNQSNYFRLFTVAASGNLTLNDTTISGGRFNTDSFDQDYAGGAILLPSSWSEVGATLTLNHCTISDNWSAYAAVSIRDYDSIVTINDSTISGNFGVEGGGIFNVGSLTINDSLITHNVARNIVFEGGIPGPEDGAGGGIYIHYNSTVTIRNSTISGNTSLDGGGIYMDGGTLDIADSTITGNKATHITSYGTTVGRGGGIYVNGNFSISHSIVAGNVDNTSIGPRAGQEVFSQQIDYTSNNVNLFGHSGLTSAQAFYHFTPGATDITAVSNGTAATALSAIVEVDGDGKPWLRDHGGPTATVALVLGSPAVDAVTGTSCPSIDQRGFPRPIDGDDDGVAHCDIGAFEFGADRIFSNGFDGADVIFSNGFEVP